MKKLGLTGLYQKLRDSLKLCKQKRIADKNVEETAQKIISIVGCNKSFIEKNYYKNENFKIEIMENNKEHFMKVLLIIMLFKIHEFLATNDCSLLSNYLISIHTSRKAIKELYFMKWNNIKELLVRREIFIELLIRSFHEGTAVEQLPHLTQKIKAKKLTKKTKKLFKAMLKNNKVESALYEIDTSGNRHKNSNKKQAIKKAKQLLGQINEYYECDLVFMKMNNYSGYTTFGGKILIDKNCLKGTRIVKQAIISMIFLHEAAHVKRRMLRDSANIFKSTPKGKLKGESGEFLEKAVSSYFPKVFSYIINNSESELFKDEIGCICNEIVDCENWNSGTIASEIQSFYTTLVHKALPVPKAKNKKINATHMKNDSFNAELDEESEIPEDYWCGTSKHPLKRSMFKIIRSEKESCEIKSSKKFKAEEEQSIKKDKN